MSEKSTTAPSPRSSRALLTRQRVLDAALELVDRDGLDELSMRKLAAALDVETMSLYKHVAGKDDLLAGLTDLMWTEIAGAAPSDDDWATWLRTFGHAVRDTVHRHPRALPVLVAGNAISVSALQLFADQLDRADSSHVERDEAVSALRTVTAFALGTAVTEHSCFGPASVHEAETERQRVLRISRALPADTPDRLVDAALNVCYCNQHQVFNEGLELIIRGCDVAN